jgi:hypothetical protein
MASNSQPRYSINKEFFAVSITPLKPLTLKNNEIYVESVNPRRGYYLYDTTEILNKLYEPISRKNTAKIFHRYIYLCYVITLKGPCHEIFDLWFFSSNNSIWAPDTRFKDFLHMASYSRRYSTMKSTFFGGQQCHWHRPPLVSGVNDTAEFSYKVCIVESAVSLTPLI